MSTAHEGQEESLPHCQARCIVADQVLHHCLGLVQLLDRLPHLLGHVSVSLKLRQIQVCMVHPHSLYLPDQNAVVTVNHQDVKVALTIT
ncbi:hypothetical protein, partial [Thiolapillus sp.]|uniref:hypothetical protein n=1 Tax=Thiolapillus sp. TaxID=2017437 RepID=UPI003AF8C0F8